jgi:hypothetical protein
MKEAKREKSSETVLFAIGTGRCGTHFLYELFDAEQSVFSCHESDPVSETFHRFSKWYRLNIDPCNFIEKKGDEINDALKEKDVFFESSAHLSLSVPELYKNFDAKFILLVRNPVHVTCSYLDKGWYNKEIEICDEDAAPSFSGDMSFHHFLGRFRPKGSELVKWKKMTRVGKLAWYWSTINQFVIKNFEDIPNENIRIEKIEELNFDKYINLCKFINIETRIDREKFERIKNRKPGSRRKKHTHKSWNKKQIKEFENEVREVAKMIGYDYKPSNVPERNSGSKFSINHIVQRFNKVLKKVYD